MTRSTSSFSPLKSASLAELNYCKLGFQIAFQRIIEIANKLQGYQAFAYIAKRTIYGKGLGVFSVRQIQYFVVTVEEGSISGAAKVLEVSPQAVSKTVSDMESSLGRPLFTRKSSGLKPTPYGKSLFKKARKTLREVRDFEDFARGYSHADRSVLQLMLCTPRFPNFNGVSSKIRTFIQRHTDIPAVVSIGSVDECIERLAIGSIDAFVTIGNTNLPGFDVDIVDRLKVGAMVYNHNPLATKSSLKLQDFTSYPLFLTPHFAFFHESVVESLMHSPNIGELSLSKLEMSLHGVFNALVTELGAITIPFINSLESWLPETVMLPFESDAMAPLPLCLVTDKEHKSDSCQVFEQLLTGGIELSLTQA